MIDMNVLRNALDVKGGDINFGGGIMLRVSPVSELPLDEILKDGVLPVEELLKLVDGSESDIPSDYRGEMDRYLADGVKWMILNALHLEQKPKELKNGEVAAIREKYQAFIVRTHDQTLTDYSVIKWVLMMQAVKDAFLLSGVTAISTKPDLYPVREIARSFPYNPSDFVIACGAGANGDGYNACQSDPCANKSDGIVCTGIGMDPGKKIAADREISYRILLH